MSILAKWMGRRLWWAMLWLMRRPWIKALQRAANRLVPDTMLSRAQESLVRQNRFARRHGLGLVTFSITVLLASVTLTGCYYVTLWMFESGAIVAPPDRYAEP